jgi:hypothetical protein
MMYSLVQYAGALTGQGYMEIDISGDSPLLVRYTDTDGNTLQMPSEPYEVHMINGDAPKPTWGQ